MHQYFDENQQPITNPDGLQQYSKVQDIEGVKTTIQYLDGNPFMVSYDCLAQEDHFRFHEKYNTGLQYQLLDGDWIYNFEPDGIAIGKVYSREISEKAILEEEWTAEGKMFNGTIYLLEDGEILYALEFDANRVFFNAYDFENGNSISLAEVKPMYEKLELALEPHQQVQFQR